MADVARNFDGNGNEESFSFPIPDGIYTFRADGGEKPDKEEKPEKPPKKPPYTGPDEPPPDPDNP